MIQLGLRPISAPITKPEAKGPHVFLKPLYNFSDPFYSLRAENGLVLRTPLADDCQAWLTVRRQSQSFLIAWEPQWASDELTRNAYRRRLRQYNKDLREEISYPFFIFRENDDQLLGGVTLTNIRRGVSQSCSIGYWIGKQFIRQGIMTRAIAAIIPFAFETLVLHRIEAACLVDNDPSKHLLEKCGFEYEGRARKYLMINDSWQDHELYALTNETGNPPQPPEGPEQTPETPV